MGTSSQVAAERGEEMVDGTDPRGPGRLPHREARIATVQGGFVTVKHGSPRFPGDFVTVRHEPRQMGVSDRTDRRFLQTGRAATLGCAGMVPRGDDT